MPNPNWVKGMESPNPAGRPPARRELAKLAILNEIVGHPEWRAIFRQMLLDSLGLMMNAESQMVRDPNSTPQSRAAAQKNLLAYGIGLPTQLIRINEGEDAFEQFAALTDEQIEAILAELDKARTLADGKENQA